MTPDEVWGNAHEGTGTRKKKNDNKGENIANNDKKSYWLQPKAYANFKDDWERVWTKLEKLRKEKCNQCKLITNSVSNGD